MKKIGVNEVCPICHCMGDHEKGCPEEPEEWKKCDHVVYAPEAVAAGIAPPGYSGCCIKCGKPIW